MKKITQKKMKRIFAYLVTVVMIFTSFMQTTIPALAAECEEHTFVYEDVETVNYSGTRTCSVYGHSELYQTPSIFTPMLNNSSKASSKYNMDSSNTISISIQMKAGTVENLVPDDRYIREYVVESSNPNVVSVNVDDQGTGTLNLLKTGISIITIYNRHNPSVKKER